MFLRKLTQALMSKGFVLGQKFYCLPFIWNDAQKRPVLSTSKTRLYLWKLNICFAFLVTLVLSYRFYCIWFISTFPGAGAGVGVAGERERREQEVIEYFYSTFILQVSWYNFFIHLSLLFAYQDIPHLFEQMMKYSEDFERNYKSREWAGRKERGSRDEMGLVFSNIYFNSVLLGVVQIGYSCWNPNYVINVFRFTYDESSFESVTSVVSLFLETVFNQIVIGYYQINLLCVCFMLEFAFGPFIIILAEVLSQLKFQVEASKSKYWTRAHLRYPNGFIKNYRALTVLINRCNSVTSYIVFIIHINLNIILGLLLYLIVRVEISILKMSAVALAVLNLIIYITVHELSGRIHEDSKKVLADRSCNKSGDRSHGHGHGSQVLSKCMRRQLKSFRPLKINIGSLSYYHRCTAIRALDTILSITVGLLIIH